MENTNTSVTIDGKFIMKANLKSIEIPLWQWVFDQFKDFLHDLPEPRRIVGIYHNPPEVLNIATEPIGSYEHGV